MSMRRLFLCVAVCFVALALSAKGNKKSVAPTRVACVGNSITYGTGIEDREHDSYPVQLQALLGDRYEVGNFGKPGATLLRHGHRPYVLQPEYQAAKEFRADIVVMHLGINDTDPRNWPDYRDEFIGDYCALVDTFRMINPRCRVIIAELTPISHRHSRFQSGTRDWREEITEEIRRVAVARDCQLIDFFTPLYNHPEMFPDGLHPNPKGAAILARTVYEGITGDFGGLQMSAVYADNMVLQHGRKLDIHGKANAGEAVTVSIAGKKYTATASDRGQWSVAIDALAAGGPYTLEVSTAARTLKYNNVLAGEVWLCSGQSNMEFRLSQAVTAKRDIPLANDDNLRLLALRPRWATYDVAWDASVLDSLNNLEYLDNEGWQPTTPATAAEFSAVAYYFGRELRDSLQVPVGLILNAVGGSPIESWIDRHTLEHQFPKILDQWRANDFIQPWVRERASKNISAATNPLQRHPYEPCYMYEAGIEPLDHYAIKGVIWYQGESNAHNKDAHARLFGLLADSWRKTFRDWHLPICFAQLSSLNRPSWPWFRDSQRRLNNDIQNTQMVVTSDVGELTDVHPRRKQEVGHRFALAALNEAYRRADVVPSGPLFRRATPAGNTMKVQFVYSEGLTTSDGEPLRTFELAGKDGIFHPATAEIRNDEVIVASPEVAEPVVVRYGWQPFTDANLINAAGLPASTFISR